MRWTKGFSTSRLALRCGTVWLLFTVSAPAQLTDKGSCEAPEPSATLTANTAIVLKLATTSLLDVGHRIPSSDQLIFLVERAEDDRVMIVSRDKAVRGWVLKEQVVRLDEAIEYFRQAIARDRRDTSAYWISARLWLHFGDADRAIVNVDQAIRQEPDQARFYVTRSLARLMKHEIDPAIADCDRAIQIDPQAKGTHVIRASAWLARGDSEKCRADLDSALAIDSINPTGKAAPVSYQLSGQGADESQKAAQNGPTATEPAPKSASELVLGGKAHMARQEYDEAVADFTEATRLDPVHAPAYAARAEAWARKHYRERELADIAQAIKLEPKNTSYRVTKAQSHSAQGRHDEAIAEFNVALGLEPENPALWVARGNEWRRDLKLELAIADYTHAIELNSNYTLAYISRGQTWRQRRDFGRAIQEFAEAARKEPTSSIAHMSLARVLATCNDPNSRNGKWAVDEATRACELTHWQDPDCLDTLAAACAESEDFPNAIKWQTRAIARLRQNAPSILLRAMDYGGRRGVGFEDRLALYKSRRPTRE
jgi:tetratricopeptide (TPR) repeat protein